MSVTIKSIADGSPAQKAGILPLDILLKISGHEIADVLDYRFFQFEQKLKIEVLRDGKKQIFKIRKEEFEELGLEFETYLMDTQHSCKNKCIFCFIDQMPKGMRKSLYFKDDDSRLSFLFGNYITLTNLNEHEIKRIIRMHISPINVSVHTTNPELRVKMMKNPNAGKSLAVLKKFDKVGISLNFQLVLCPGINDGAELERSLSDLLKLKSVASIACVPVGLTKYREGLPQLKPYDKASAQVVIDTINGFGDENLISRGERICYPSDEFYLLAGREMPDVEYYGDFLQLENGVGMWTLLKSECEKEIAQIDPTAVSPRHISLASGLSAAPLVKYIVALCEEKFKDFRCEVYPIVNNFFGELITVAGLVTATDIKSQLVGKDLGTELFIPSVMLKSDEDIFLDDISLSQLSENLGVKITAVPSGGYELISALLNLNNE